MSESTKLLEFWILESGNGANTCIFKEPTIYANDGSGPITTRVIVYEAYQSALDVIGTLKNRMAIEYNQRKSEEEFLLAEIERLASQVSYLVSQDIADGAAHLSVMQEKDLEIENLNSELARHKELLRKQCNHSQDLSEERDQLNTMLREFDVSALEARERMEKNLQVQLDYIVKQVEILKKGLDWYSDGLYPNDASEYNGAFRAGRRAREALAAVAKLESGSGK